MLKEIQTLLFKFFFWKQNPNNLLLESSHCDITGNEEADKYAKLAANIQRECIKLISALDMKPHV